MTHPHATRTVGTRFRARRFVPRRSDWSRARSANHVVKETETWRSQAGGFPQDAVVVAEDQGGNAIVLLPGDDGFYVWDHELRETEPIELLFDE